MTLPFRRRHNDAEASHDRARSLIASGLLDPLEAADSAWLAAHLGGCPECTADAEAYEADRQLLRSLRDRPIEPPRDLWARTAAEIERSRGRGVRSTTALPHRFGRLPLGVASGLLVVLVVIGAALAPRMGLPLVGPGLSGSANRSAGTEATPIAVTADALAWIQVSPDGSYEFLQANVDEVCADAREGCAPLNTRNSTRLRLTQAPQSVLLSPNQAQIAVVTKSTASSGSAIVVVPVPTVAPQGPSPAPTASAEATPPVGTPGASASPPEATPTPVPTPGPSPTTAPGVSPLPSASGEPPAGHAIVSGVIVVGDAAYSADGAWLAFSARPADGSSGPDLYTWRVGDELATPVTTDHRTFFSGWLGSTIVANRVEPGDERPGASAGPDPSIRPTAATAVPSAGPASSPSASPAAVQDHPVAFLLDPVTNAITPLGATDIWHPTFDPTGASVVYWAGTLVRDASGTGWTLGTGQLVIDGWNDGTPSASTGAATSPAASPGPTIVPVGPAGHPAALTSDPVTDFDAWFDPTGTRLAIWIADPADATIGTLRLEVIDPHTGLVDATAAPLPGVSALRGVSISSGRLAWVTPPGQDGQGSHVQVLAWNGRDFGQVRTIQGDRFLVAR
ncbi:MAG: hypothetical protein HY264_00265 [Chloroflexi bacterium]|nr:hypothetical protein [Chloroflexota bacterium]